MLTAKKAQELADKASTHVQRKVEKLLTAILERALLGYRDIDTNSQYIEDSDLWQNGAYNDSEEFRAAKKILEDLGYKVTGKDESKQFVHYYTIVKW